MIHDSMTFNEEVEFNWNDYYYAAFISVFEIDSYYAGNIDALYAN